jgi:hypothetical protein
VAYNKATAWFKSHSDSEVAQQLLKSDAFKTFSLDQLTSYVAYDRPFVAPNNGLITPDMWKTGLQVYAKWGIDGFDPADPTYAFDKRVDMSFLEQATKK